MKVPQRSKLPLVLFLNRLGSPSLTYLFTKCWLPLSMLMMLMITMMTIPTNEQAIPPPSQKSGSRIVIDTEKSGRFLRAFCTTASVAGTLY